MMSQLLDGRHEDTVHCAVEGLPHKGIPCYAVSDGILKKITHTSRVFPYIGVAALPQELGEVMDNVVLVMEHIESHYTLGNTADVGRRLVRWVFATFSRLIKVRHI